MAPIGGPERRKEGPHARAGRIGRGMEEPSLDVVIVTRDRPLRLAALLGDLSEGAYRPRTITLVDDSPQPSDWSKSFPTLPLQTLRPSRRTFISAAKNAGARGGTAPFVAFVDDDNRLPPDVLPTLVRDLETHPDWGAVMPGVVYHQRPELVWVYATPFRPDRWEFDLVGRNHPRQAPLEHRYLPTDALPNLSVVRRSGMEAVGGFDEGFPVNSSADLCQRMKSAGWVVQADTGVLTRHDVEPPGTPGYWAEHAVVDPYRARHEVADWFRFHRRWGPAGPGFAARASARALRFLLPTIVAAAIRPVPHRLRLMVSLGQGYRDGLFGPMPASPAPWAAANDGGGRPPESHFEKG